MSFSLNQLPTQVPSANPTADVLAEHARAIRELAARTRENIIAIGRHLTEVRDQIEPGEWLAWLEAEFGWSDQTARRFMHVYGLSRDARLNTCVELDLPLHVLYCLAAPKAEDARQEIADRIAAGEEVTRETVEEAIARIRQKGRAIEEAIAAAAPGDTLFSESANSGTAPGAIAPASWPKPRSRKSRFDAEHYASVVGRRLSQEVSGLINLLDEYPDRFDAVLDHLRGNSDFIEAVTELMRQPKLRAALEEAAGGAAPDGHVEYSCNPAVSEFFSTAGGVDIFEWVPAGRRIEVARGFLDKLTVAGVLGERHDIGPYSPDENDQLRARVEELGNAKRVLEIKIIGLEGEVAQLKQQLGHGTGSPGDDFDVRTFNGGILLRGQP